MILPLIVVPGDLVEVAIQFTGTSSVHAQISVQFTNWTQKTYINFAVINPFPLNESDPRSSAEWIVERPGDPASPTGPDALPRFGSVYFDDARCTANGKILTYQQANASELIMYNKIPHGYAIAQPYAISDYMFGVDYTNPDG